MTHPAVKVAAIGAAVIGAGYVALVLMVWGTACIVDLRLEVDAEDEGAVS